jgi:hypothetical protein
MNKASNLAGNAKAERFRRQRERDALGRCEFVENRLRRYPPDRASAVSYGQEYVPSTVLRS